MPSLPVEILELEARLIGVDPPIWRRLKIPSQYSLADLHLILQALMGWENKHLYDFSYGDRHFEAHDVESRGEDAAEVCLIDLKLEPGASLRYVYDFGDQWTMAVIVVDQDYGAAMAPVCTAGERAAPPEDAGGAHQYSEMVRALQDPAAHPDMQELLDWLPTGFDPERFDRVAVDNRLKGRAGRAI